MQLLKIYKKYTIVILALVLLIGSLFHFLILTYFIHHSADHTLREYRYNIERYVVEHDTLDLSDNQLLDNSRVSWLLQPDDVFVQEHVRDTMVYSDYKKEMVVFRLMSFTLKCRNENFLITLWQVSLDSEDLLLAILVSLIILFCSFLLFSFWLTKWFVRRLWHPFYAILEQLREVDLMSLHAVSIPVCQVDEFNKLSRTLNRMLDRIHEDYISLRELTETTAHELQTPLSIVKARLELLQQSEENSEQYTELIRSVSNAVDRVIRLNRFMLMIAKINNDQFPASSNVAVNDFIDDFLTSYEDVIEVKELTVIKQYIEPMSICINSQMAEILVSNLLSNAIKYNIEGGYIRVETTAQGLQIYNPYINVIPSGDLFARFKKSSTTQDSTGLGLAIVRSICQKNNLNAIVDVTADLFCIKISQQ